MLQVKRGSIRWGSPCLRGYPEGGLHRVSHAESGGPKFDDMADNPELRAEIRAFLVSRRARITPEQAGLRAFGNNRRVAGLRREEVATLAGVSAEYYTRIERGNVTGVSETVRGYQVVCVNTSKELSTDDGCRDERAGAGRAGAGDGGGAGRGGQVGPGRFAGRVDGPSRRGLIAIDRGGRVFAGAGEAGVGGGPGCGADRPSGL